MHLASLPSQYLIRNSPQKASITVSPFCQIKSRLSPLCRLGQSQLSKFKYVIWSCLLGLVPLGNEKLIFFFPYGNLPVYPNPQLALAADS